MNFRTLSGLFRVRAKEILTKKYEDPKVAASTRFRAASYNKAAALFEADELINKKVNEKAISGLPLTDYMKKKAIEYSKDLNLTNKNASNNRLLNNRLLNNRLLNNLIDIKGIGKERANELIKNGLTNIKQLKLKKFYNTLPEETKMFLTLAPSQKIPHEHIKVFEVQLMKLATSTIKLYITGSYRRKKPFSSDIDVMVVSNTANSLQLIHDKLNKLLKGKIYTYAQGPDKMSFIVDLTDLITKDLLNAIPNTPIKQNSTTPNTPIKQNATSNTPIKQAKLVYKMDMFYTNLTDSVPMLLYSTGSKEFNVTMRSKAKKLGYLLNQKGLFYNVKRNSQPQTDNWVKVPGLKTEKDYFDKLNMIYKLPEDR